MFSKVFVYGLTFGSAAAALQFMFFSNALYQEPKQALLSFVLLLIIYVVSIVLCIKSMVRDSASLTIKKTIAAGISVAVLIGVSMALIGWIIERFYPSIIEQLISFQQLRAKTPLTSEDIVGIRKMFKFKTVLPMFMSLSFSVGLMVSSAMVLIYQKRVIK